MKHAHHIPEPARTTGLRSLTDAEIEEFLRHHWWGMLATSSNGRPYAVPVAYGMEGGGFVFASQDGMKTRFMESNPFVSLTVADVIDGSTWTSVVVTGGVIRVRQAHEVVAALMGIQRQTGKAASLSPVEAARLVGAKIYRIFPLRVSGRARGSAASWAAADAGHND